MAVEFSTPASAAGIAAAMGLPPSLTYKLPVVLGASGTAASVTGTTNETQLASITIPANSMGANGKLRITTTWSFTNSANNKTLRVRFSGAGGTAYLSTTQTTTTQAQVITIISNANAENSQKGFPTFAGIGTSTSAVATSAVDTTADSTVYISGQLTNTGEEIKLESYTVELIPGV